MASWVFSASSAVAFVYPPAAFLLRLAVAAVAAAAAVETAVVTAVPAAAPTVAVTFAAVVVVLIAVLFFAFVFVSSAVVFVAAADVDPEISALSSRPFATWRSPPPA